MKKQKSLTNKGFSLVELIIVVAIMAILIAILAPQYLRYVERTRIQKDNTAMDEVANAIKVAAADEDIIQEIGATGNDITITFTSTTGIGASFATGTYALLEPEVEATVGDLEDIVLTSNTYRTAGTVTLTVSVTNNIVTISADKWYEKVGGGDQGPKNF